MNKKSLILLSIVAAVILVISYCYWGGSRDQQVAPSLPPELPNPQASVSQAGRGNSEVPPAEPPSGGAAGGSSSGNGFLPTKMEDPKRFELLKKNFKDMSVCLNMKTGALSENDDINFETLNTIIGPDLGDVVTTTEEWSATDIKTNSGEIHRIFVQQTVNSEGQPVRILKYYAMSPGGQKELPLTKDQSVNPTDTLLASLEADGQLVTKSVARKVYYQNGDDLNVVERNGKLYSFDLAHDQKTFKCSGLDSSTNMSCACK